MRYWEIDAVRGVAVLLMIIYHIIFDITYFTSGNVPVWFAFIIASLFIIASGVSLNISYHKNNSPLKFAKRGIKLLLLGFFITAVSYLFLKNGFIIFGIIHFFGLSSFLIYPFLKYLKTNSSYLFLGIFIIVTGILILNFSYQSIYFVWLGLKPANFYSFDYFPLLPWFGLLLIGIFLGNIFYPNGKRNFKIFIPEGKVANIITFLGKNSLLIYFIHQPIIFFVLLLFGYGGFLSAFVF